MNLIHSYTKMKNTAHLALFEKGENLRMSEKTREK
jgi:hypothetical protein